MSNRKHNQPPPENPPGAANNSAFIYDLSAYRALQPPPDPQRDPLTGDERALLRLLLELGPARIVAAVRQMEHIKHACPTARRELEDVRLME